MLVSIMAHNSADEVKISLVYDTRENKFTDLVKSAINTALDEGKVAYLDTLDNDTFVSWHIHAKDQSECDLDYWSDFVVDALNEVIDYWEYDLQLKASLDCMQVYSLDL